MSHRTSSKSLSTPHFRPSTKRVRASTRPAFAQVHRSLVLFNVLSVVLLFSVCLMLHAVSTLYGQYFGSFSNNQLICTAYRTSIRRFVQLCTTLFHLIFLNGLSGGDTNRKKLMRGMKSMSVDCPDNHSAKHHIDANPSPPQPEVAPVQRLRRERFVSNKSISLDPDWLNSRAKESSVASTHVGPSVLALLRL